VLHFFFSLLLQKGVMATPNEAWPTGTVATTALIAVSITETEPEIQFAT
jgi:hypothetical protein